MLAPLKSSDSPEVTRQKIVEVAHYIETFAVKRSINFRTFGASSIRYTMYMLVKELRGKDLDSLTAILRGKLDEMDESWEGFAQFRMHGMNKWFVKYLLSRITGFIEQRSGHSTSFRLTTSAPERNLTKSSISGRTSLTSTAMSLSSKMTSTTIATGSAIWCFYQKGQTNRLAP